MMQIHEKRFWDKNSVRHVCINNGLYTHGSNEDYNELLEYVGLHDPDTEAIQRVAADIAEHSGAIDTDDAIANIMFMLANNAVTYFYERE